MQNKKYEFLLNYGPLIICSVLLTFAMFKIQTYVCNHDPFVYISLARRILNEPWNSHEFIFGLSAITPLHTLILASSIKLFGIFAPYWVNFVFCLAFFFVLALLLRRMFQNRAAEAVTIFFLLYIMVCAYPMSLRFLL